MAKSRKKKSFPFKGTIYVPANCKRIYIKYSDAKTGKYRRIATGLKDTAEGYEIAEAMLRRLFMESASYKIVDMSPKSEASSPKEAISKAQSLSVQELWDKFMELHGANKMPKTTQMYQEAFMKIIPSARRVEHISVELLEECIGQFVSTSRLRPASINIYVRSFQVFVSFLSQRQIIEPKNFYKQFRKAAAPKKHEVFSDKEVFALVGYFKDKGRLDMALFIEFLYYTGFRIGQALALLWSDVDDKYIYRRSKDKERNEPFPLMNELQRILQEMPRYKDKPEKVFYWATNSQAALSRDLNAAMKELHIPKNNRGWHVFRKTAATRWAEAGLPIQEVQKLLGHSRVEVTASVYVGVEMQKVGDKLNKMHKKEAVQI